ncbi:hypothetical protein PFICI_08342 [Pestalotiopsis fici W106-1]|uniref:AAA+ ATPase domain-containing protein n=1 Tax=Pestalotiopsis fici (strain W106-1 / CGMCC3.15140) TaxID=1229662 RepID=W3X3V6_PESFW|nr:uncharacterized protein PFICI_08342 [Pestalotiopsis fici W106-1]ETS80813.1 hypothetical protein PFICI_08342 [Pestalotiopsis fici W106-1]
MDSMTDRDKLALLAKQETTDGPHNVFDISQFEHQVDQKVSPKVIERLQKEFGNDMAGAIDKFFGMKNKSPEQEPPNGKAETDGESGSESEGNPTPDLDNRQEIVTRDRYWDRFKRQFVLKKPAKPKNESRRYKDCVIFVRRDYNPEMTDYQTVLIISGEVLRNALRNIFRGAAGFGLTENIITELDPSFMFWARPEFELLAKHYHEVGDKTAVFEMGAAFNFIDTQYGEMVSVLDSLLPHSITFEYLWAILPPDCLIVGTDALDFQSIWCVRSHSVQCIQGQNFLIMEAENIIWDGSKAGSVHQMLRIPMFTGVKLIRDLPYIPLDYHPQREEAMKNVLKRSVKALEFWQPHFRHLEHQGTGLAKVHDKVDYYPFSGRVVVDPKTMRRMDPSNPVMPHSSAISNLRKISRVSMAEFSMSHEGPNTSEELLKELLKDASDAMLEFVGGDSGKHNARNRSYGRGRPPPRVPGIMRPPPGLPPFYRSSSSSSGSASSSDNETWTSLPASRQNRSTARRVQLSKKQMLLVSGFVYGYSLRDSTWGAFSVDRVSEIDWNETIFDSLVMEKSLKDVIYQLVVAHGAGNSDFDDLIKGKGKGLVGLLYGPPGSGKTLTAEAIAETAKMPLYAISSGALGHEATKIHDKLSSILKLASHWKAVLLLDEADVFLAQRTTTDIERNAIVSVFLRELEYYQGILILTTNQAQVIDEAFQSRIHLSLQYFSLDTASRYRVWDSLMENARKSKRIKVDVTQDALQTLAEVPLNGRQIKNTISIAVNIATTSESQVMTAETLSNTARLLQNSQFRRQESDHGEGSRTLAKGVLADSGDDELATNTVRQTTNSTAKENQFMISPRTMALLIGFLGAFLWNTYLT